MEHTFKGHGSTLVVLEDSILLNHGKSKQFTSKSKSTVQIHFTELDTLILDKPGLLSGYCYFLRKGYTIEGLSKPDIMVDEYAITLAFSHQYKRFLKAKDLIDKHLENIPDSPTDNTKTTKLNNMIADLIQDPNKSVKYNGYSGSLIIKADTVTIQYKAILHRGGKGFKTIDIDKISSLALAKPSFPGGKVKIFYEGFTNRGYRDINEEANEITITNINQYNQMLEAKELILALKRYHENQVHSTDSLSPADEIRKYKSLLDDGIISEEEFEKKKKELLN
ncbi:SHOCT domain-containing protein [Shouchella clausii]|uniref:SHOCT domain-containing protein n=1 Tax=Shouchella clausii TaxID=79880 RepID=UPI002175F985|nr:SHOCT domain-containing protein [Shouchella clausii]